MNKICFHGTFSERPFDIDEKFALPMKIVEQ